MIQSCRTKIELHTGHILSLAATSPCCSRVSCCSNKSVLQQQVRVAREYRVAAISPCCSNKSVLLESIVLQQHVCVAGTSPCCSNKSVLDIDISAICVAATQYTRVAATFDTDLLQLECTVLQQRVYRVAARVYPVAATSRCGVARVSHGTHINESSHTYE